MFFNGFKVCKEGANGEEKEDEFQMIVKQRAIQI
jgi:hypothetical protein